MQAAGLRTARNIIATSPEEAQAALEFGLPLIIRPAFTLGGRGGGIARTQEQFDEIVGRGLDASPIGQILIDESILGWGEFELEVMRDHADNVVIVCSIENIDPMGVHTGDSVTVAPQQTLTRPRLPEAARPGDRGHPRRRRGDGRLERAVRGQRGDRRDRRHRDEPARVAVAALASKATGFPIAKIAARLAVGYTLDEIPNDITKATPASFEPTLDYVVVKWPRFAFEKFPGVDTTLSTHMKSVGEVMAIGRTFGQAFGKALRSRELDAQADVTGTDEELLTRLESPSADRYDVLLELQSRGVTDEELRARTGIDMWYLRELRHLDDAFDGVRTYRAVDTCAAEFEAETPYYYSAWETHAGPSEVRRGDKPSVMILGSGPEPDRPGHRVRLLLRARRDDRARVRP